MANNDHSPPAGWQLVPLRKVAEVRFSSVDKKSYPLQRRVRLCNYTDVYNNESIREGMPFMEATASEAEFIQFGLRQGDIIITKDSETPDDIGVPTIIREDIPDLVCGYHLSLIRPDSRKVDSVFLARQLKHWRIAGHFAIFANGITRYGLPKASVENAPVWLPDLAVQRRIADILDAADEAIRRTEAVIAKLKLMKDGLLHDLLTRGLDAHGRLRDPVAHPEQFKDSPLGRIPKEWVCVKMAKVTTAAEYGVSVPLFDAGETPVLRMNNLSGGHINLSELRYSSEAVAGRLLLHRGDILFNRTNSIDHVGRTSIWNDELARASFASYCVRFTSHRDTVTPELLVYFMNLPQTQLAIKRLSTPAVQQVNVNPTKLRQLLLVAYPERMEEQDRIVQLLQAAEESERREQRELQKLRLQKTGLMHDLLTGRVSVSATEVARRA